MTRSASELVQALRGMIDDERVLQAIGEVPRDMFVPGAVRNHAWENRALPIGAGQTISQPTVVARMCELLGLRGDERVLDVGTGSGYHAAILSRLAAQVYSIEREATLSSRAQAASHLIPTALVQQLALGGRLVIPIDGDAQRLTLVHRTGAGIRRQDLDPVRFVPLVSDRGGE